MSATPSVAAQAKAELRARILAERRRRSAATRAADANALTQHLAHELAKHPAQDIAAYLPLGTEPPLLDALAHAHAVGHGVWVPVVEPNFTLRWCAWHPDIPLQPGNLPGLMEPTGPRHGLNVFNSVGLVIVPAVAVSADGVRLGFGGGYYDRFLAALEDTMGLPRLLACVFHREILPPAAVPGEAHDAVLPEVLTELGVVALNGTHPHCARQRSE